MAETASRRHRVTTLSLVVLCQSFQALTIGGIALFLPLIRRDLHLTFAQGGTLAAASTLMYALMQIPAGYLADRFGARRLFIIGLTGTMALSFYLGTTTAYWQALLSQSFSGLFRALLFAPGMALITGWFPPERRATAMGLYLIGGFSGNLLLDIIGPLLVTRMDWRFPFLMFSTIGLVAALLLWRFGKDPPRTVKPRDKIAFREAVQLFRQRVMWLCGGIQYVRLAVTQGIAFWLPSLLVDEKGLSLQAAGWLLALRAALIAPSNVVGGYVSDRLKNPTLVIGISLVVLMLTTLLMVVPMDIWLLIVVIAVNAVFVQMYFGPLFSVPVEILGDCRAGTLTGFGNLFANVGAFSFTFALGVLKDATGSFSYGFGAISIACLVGLVLTVALAGLRRTALNSSAIKPRTLS